MSYSDNDPAELARTKFPGFTDEQRVAIVERARELARKDGGGIALLPPASVDSLLNQAERDIKAAAKSKGETDFTADDLDYMNAARLAFGKAGQDKPMAHRGDFVRKYGVEKYNAEMTKWGASPTNFAPCKNPYGKRAKKALKAAREGILEPTAFNTALHGDQVKPPKVKLTKEQKAGNPFSAASWNLTEQGRLVRSNPSLAAAMAAREGVTIGATKPR